MPTSLISNSLALAAFLIAVISGLRVGNTGAMTLFRALLVMFACWLLGQVIAGIAQAAVRDDIRRQRRKALAMAGGADVPEEESEKKDLRGEGIEV